MIIDSHCHLDYPHLYDQLDKVVERALQNKVSYLLTICTTLKSFDKIKLITDKYKKSVLISRNTVQKRRKSR